MPEIEERDESGRTVFRAQVLADHRGCFGIALCPIPRGEWQPGRCDIDGCPERRKYARRALDLWGND